MYKADKILILAPHTDDGEFGCGGSMSKWLLKNKSVYYAAFSSAEKSVPSGMPKDILKKEVKKAMAVLGIPNENLILFNYPVRDFPIHRQEILEDLIILERTLQPDIVFMPSTTDTHQDHQVICREGFRAFKKTSIIGYEMPYNNLTFTTDLFISIEAENLTAKLKALQCYKSQKGRLYAIKDFVKGLARTRGVQIGVQYAEAFEVIRWVIK